MWENEWKATFGKSVKENSVLEGHPVSFKTRMCGNISEDSGDIEELVSQEK